MSEYIFNLHDFALFATALECVLLTIFQAVQPQGNKQAKLFLGAFLCAMAVSSICVMLVWNTVVSLPNFFNTYLLPFLLVLSLSARGPFLYLYARAITTANFKFHKGLLWHLSIVAIAFMYLLIYQPTSSHLRMESLSPDVQFRNNLLWDLIIYVTVAYTGATLYQLHRYKRLLEESYSIFSTFEINWLSTLTLGFFISWSWGTITHIVGQHTNIDGSIKDAMGITTNYLNFVLINILFIYSLLFAHKLLPAQTEEKKSKANTETLDDDAIAAVTAAMENDKIYLEKNINIEQLAKKVNLPVKTVSLVINRHFNTSFFEFINSHRIEAAKSMLTSREYADKTILEILYEAGFNSTSSFHRQFKRYTNLSPSEFRQQAKAAIIEE